MRSVCSAAISSRLAISIGSKDSRAGGSLRDMRRSSPSLARPALRDGALRRLLRVRLL